MLRLLSLRLLLLWCALVLPAVRASAYLQLLPER